jgi:FtsP/CotA-like multicopper oxidase with cupredoxin domain
MDWAHDSPFSEWWWDRPTYGPPPQASALINGTNVFDCRADKSNSTQCEGKGMVGNRFEVTFEQGKKYRMRLVNAGLYSHFRFAIDGHNLTVIGMDFVPIVPYTTDSVLISMGQRYDIIVEANAPPANYWLRPIWQRSCCDNDAWNNTLGIVRYAEANSNADPTTTNIALSYPSQCEDEPYNKLVPYVPLDVPMPESISLLNLNYSFVPMPAGFLFTLNNSYIWVNFSAPTDLLLSQGENNWPNTGYTPQKGFTDYDAIPLAIADQWVYFGLQDISHRNRSHPMHLHGHDYYVLGQGFGLLDGTVNLTLSNPPRRDVATLPLNGYMIMAFKTDNPGAWLMHCHIAAHSSEGLGLQFVERQDEIMATFEDVYSLQQTCATWQNYWSQSGDFQEDAGI